MVSKKELQTAYGLAIVLFIVGVISYAAFPAKTPERPVRIMFQGIAGTVLFDHKTHTDASGYGLSCRDCHHTLEEGETEAPSCLQCHEPESDDASVPKRSDAFHKQCIECHTQIEAGPQECASCHVP
ncbi:MAG: cytochrome c3 family protein [Thermodesulfobacteriota bacterium]